MSHIRRDDRRSVRYTGLSEVTCDLAPVRPSDVTSRPVVHCSGHIDRSSERCGSNPTRVVTLTANASRFLAGIVSAGIRFGRQCLRQILRCRWSLRTNPS